MLTPTKRTGCIINALNFNYDKLDKASNLMSKNFEKDLSAELADT